MAIVLVTFAALANSTMFFKTMNVNNEIAITVVTCACFVLVTASIGCTAAASKNECLTFLVKPLH